jgi:EmrB/QacA subfamily drug resistance transporter
VGAQAAGEQATGLTHGRRLLVLAVCCLSLFIVGLDTTVVNVALPAIQSDLHASVDGLQWTIDAYTLVLASLLILAGSSGDRVGRRRVFEIGLVVFSLGSLLCGLAPSLGLLVAARVLQAIGGSMLNPVALSIIRNVFDDPRERARAIGLWGAVFGLSMALGPVVGGALVDSVSWRAVFFVNVPIGIIAILLTARFVPESRAPRSRRLDPVGQVLVIAGLASLTYAIIEGPRHGWVSGEILGLFAAGAVCAVALLAYERRRFEPLIEIRFFGSVPFSGASAIAVLTFAGLGGFLFLNTLYLQDVRGLSPLQAGLYMLPVGVVLLLVSPLSGRLVARYGARPPLVSGGFAMTAAVLMLTGLTRATGTGYLLASYGLFGVGMGLLGPPITNTAVSGMPGEQAGVAAAIASTSRQVGMTLGVAVIGAIAGGSVAGAIGASFAQATHPGWWVIVALGVLILAASFLSTGAWAERTARRTADRLREPPVSSRCRSDGEMSSHGLPREAEPATVSAGSRGGAGTGQARR